ncbi:MAG: hypothetical protein DI598_10045 [Pseudopedobacter saltans]|uniref:DUF3822 domain-containing protein n=1 Tax=Pseudopedobacter saltans TaxID=151895 RepID=A0A2W5F0Q0_9SPHI|nr:MAG: hypothetical protein DI598_10045 [Pseudopedobacter saltans]
MAQKILGIYSPSTTKDRLFLEISKDHIACWILNNETGELLSFELFQLKPEKSFEESFKAVMQNSGLLAQYNAKEEVHVIWENEFAEILPQTYLESCSDNIIKMMMPYQSNDTKIQHYETNGFSVLYQVDQSISETIHNVFPNYKSVHKYGAISKVLINSIAKPELVLHLLCFQKHSILTAVQDGQLLFIKRIKFLSPLDAVYHVVNAANQYGKNMDDVTVVLSGMVENNSSLFDAIYKYIPHIEIDSVTKNLFDTEKFSDYPEHFFVPFFKYAI